MPEITTYTQRIFHRLSARNTVVPYDVVEGSSFTVTLVEGTQVPTAFTPTFASIRAYDTYNVQIEWTNYVAGQSCIVEVHASRVENAAGAEVSPVFVTDHGAVGDGVTDDAAAVNNAVTAAVASGVNWIHFPPTAQSYRLDKGGLTTGGPSVLARITLPNNFRVTGEGISSKIYVTGVSPLSLGDPGYNNDWVLFRVPVGGHDISFENLYFYGENGTSTGVGFKKVDQGQHACIEFEASTPGDNTNNSVIRDCEFWQLYGFAAHAPGQVRRVHFIHNRLRWCANGVNLNAIDSIQDHNDLSESEGFENAGFNFSISHNRFKNMYGAPISAGGNNSAYVIERGAIIIGNTIDRVYDGIGILLSDAMNYSMVSNNHIKNCYSFGIRSDITGAVPDPGVPALWLASTVYAAGAQVRNGTPSRVYTATVGGTSAGAGGPTGTGTGIVDNTVTWSYIRDYVVAYNTGNIIQNNTVSSCGWTGGANAWLPVTPYIVGQRVTNGSPSRIYVCLAPGTSAGVGGPTGTATSIVDGGATGPVWSFLYAVPNWAASTAYVAGDLALNSGNVYQCRDPGTSASSGGPTGTGSNITDGSANWRFLNAGGASPNRLGISVSGQGRHIIRDNIVIDETLAFYGQDQAISIGAVPDVTVTGNLCATTASTSEAIILNGCTNAVILDNHKTNGGRIYNVLAGTTLSTNRLETRTMTDIVEAYREYTDVFDRYTIDGNGRKGWGAGGGSATDVFLERSAVGTMRTVGRMTATTGFGSVSGDSTGTPGNATLNTPQGRSAIAAAASTATITNSLVAAGDAILITPLSVDATLTRFSAVAGAGSFVVTGNAVATATWSFQWTVLKAS